MKNEPLTRTQILQTLREQLDDQILQRLFPGHSADDIRHSLTGGSTAQTVHADCSRGTSPRPAPQHSAGGLCCQLFTDGASRGNPGKAGAGAVLLDAQNSEIKTRSEYLGICTNNVAEYKALIIGLQEALQHQCTEIDIALDSELIVRQIQGRYKVKNEFLLPLFNEVRMLLARFGKWSIRHVVRAQNARADQLANEGIDEQLKR